MRLCLDTDQTTPTFFSFVLTDEFNDRLYCASLLIYEPLPPNLRPQLESTYYIEGLNILCPKALCIISKHSFVGQYKEILKQLYRLHISQSHVPIERYICNFTDEIPLPIKGKNATEYELGSSVITFTRPLNQISPYANVCSLHNPIE